jgi:hypothetical protein
MKTKIILSVAFVATMAAFSACYSTAFGTIHGSGKLVQNERNLGDFTGVEIASSANVYIRQGDKTSVKIEGDDNIVPDVTTDVRNGTLVISNKPGSYQHKLELKVFVTVKDLKVLTVTGSGDIKGETPFTISDLVLNIVGSSDIILDLNANKIESNLAGSGDIVLSGSCKEHETNLAGSGNINATKLKSRKSDVHISGSGNCKVDASELYVAISGSGDVFYKGNPEKLQTSVTGSGDVHQMN